MGSHDNRYYYERLSSNDNSITSTQFLPSSSEGGASFFFTEDHNKHGWGNNKGTKNDPVTNDDEQNDGTFEDHVVGKSYSVFESKLKQGFLEAPNLGLVSAPPAMFDYQPPLQRIDLKDNKIEVLSENFFDELPHLMWCDLRYNRLHSLPPMTEPHHNLQVLLLQDNQLTSLPCSLAHAVNLHSLGWTNNSIVEPPRSILLQGCQKTLEYLRSELDSGESSLGLETDQTFVHDEQLKRDLEKTARKKVSKLSKSRSSIFSDDSEKANKKKEEDERKRRIDRLKYTWDLWKSIPYNGVNNHALFEKSVQEAKDEVKMKFNQQKEAILQKMRDNDALGKWRWEAKMLQMKGKPKPYDGVQMPFGTNADIEKGSNPSAYNLVDPATFKTTVDECMKRLQLLSENPAPVSDMEKSLGRLKEVEEIQRKLFNMKLKFSVKASNPI